MTYTTNSEDQTKKIARDFAKSLRGGEVVLLEGELGAGKSTFVRGVAEALGYDGPVRSPTFTIMNRYPATRGSIKEILHIDLYRLEDPKDLRTLALEEELGRASTVSLIEWPMEHASVPDNAIKIKIEITGEHTRDIQIQKQKHRA